jgi:hypothetical protein
MTKAFIRCLIELLEDPYENDIIVEAGQAYCGNTRIHRSTVNKLLSCAAIKDSGSDRGKFERYVVNEDFAKQIVADPSLADKIMLAFMGNRNFDVREGKIVWIDE